MVLPEIKDDQMMMIIRDLNISLTNERCLSLSILLTNERCLNMLLTNNSGCAAVRGLPSVTEVVSDQVLCQ